MKNNIQKNAPHRYILVFIYSLDVHSTVTIFFVFAKRIPVKIHVLTVTKNVIGLENLATSISGLQAQQHTLRLTRHQTRVAKLFWPLL